MQSKVVNMRLDGRLIRQIDLVVGDSGSVYASRTDFLRDAARRLIDEHRTRRALAALEKYYGYGKKLGKNVTDEDIERAKETAWKKLHGSK